MHHIAHQMVVGKSQQNRGGVIRMEQKYSYYLDGRLYYVLLTPEEKVLFENRYGVCLSLVH
jgi:hypothetical protein